MTAFTDAEWSSPEADLTPEEYARVCLIVLPHDGPVTKAMSKLPIRSTPGGPVNKAALQNAAGRIFQMTGVPADEKKKAARRLVSLMREAGMQIGSQSLMRMAGMV